MTKQEELFLRELKELMNKHKVIIAEAENYNEEDYMGSNYRFVGPNISINLDAIII